MPMNKQERIWVKEYVEQKGEGEGERGEEGFPYRRREHPLHFVFLHFVFFTFVGLGLSWPRGLRICSSNALISLGGTAPEVLLWSLLTCCLSS